MADGAAAGQPRQHDHHALGPRGTHKFVEQAALFHAERHHCGPERLGAAESLESVAAEKPHEGQALRVQLRARGGLLGGLAREEAEQAAVDVPRRRREGLRKRLASRSARRALGETVLEGGDPELEVWIFGCVHFLFWGRLIASGPWVPCDRGVGFQ